MSWMPNHLIRPFLYSRDEWPIKDDPEIDRAFEKLRVQCRSGEVMARYQALLLSLEIYGWRWPLNDRRAKMILLDRIK